MGTVTSITDAPAARREYIARAAARHPALRWVAGELFWRAHRRNHDTGTAACGASGTLMLATPGVPSCEDCYPRAGRS